MYIQKKKKKKDKLIRNKIIHRNNLPKPQLLHHRINIKSDFLHQTNLLPQQILGNTRARLLAIQQKKVPMRRSPRRRTSRDPGHNRGVVALKLKNRTTATTSRC